MWSERSRPAWRAAVLPLVLALGVAWTVLLGAAAVGRAEPPAAFDTPRSVVAVAIAPPSAAPVLPEARLIERPAPGALLLLVAAIAGLLLGARRRITWPTAAGSGAAVTPAALFEARRGRAPLRREASDLE
ncbi:hypothetical protein GCM10010109_53340 [Actinoplanes campanulatus]|nr:hypothetical protein GCM10010109_53340 [Actinoplanes campanulatus]GID40031.1 hypothetical protein Aca09nite_65370 [Actinoplanes campanulatus]